MIDNFFFAIGLYQVIGSKHSHGFNLFVNRMMKKSKERTFPHAPLKKQKQGMGTSPFLQFLSQ